MKRTASEFIAELREESARFTGGCALVVGNVEESDFVWNHDPDPLAKLNTAMTKGVPYGIIGLVTKGETTTIYARLLEEFARSDHFRARLHHVVVTMLANAKTKTEWQTGWVM